MAGLKNLHLSLPTKKQNTHPNRWAMVIKTALPLGHEMDF